jgi:hypothetical protein
MTKTEAIKKATHCVSIGYTYDGTNFWAETRPANQDARIWLRNRRVIYALQLLGEPSIAIAFYLSDSLQGSVADLVNDFLRTHHGKN